MFKQGKTKARHLLKRHCGVIAYAKLMGVNSERVRVAMEAGEIVPDLVGTEGNEMIDLRRYGGYVFVDGTENIAESSRLSGKEERGEK